MLEKDIPYFHDGVDYSDFPEKLKTYYREQHLKAINFKKPIVITISSWSHVEHHTNPLFHEEMKRRGDKRYLGGWAGHMKNCHAQYYKNRVNTKLNLPKSLKINDLPI